MTKEFLRRGHQGSAFDISFSDEHNILDTRGLRLILEAVCSLKRKGMLWLATVCSSFVVLCRAQSLRVPSNSFLGDLGRDWVRRGNAMMEASSLCYLIAWALNIYVILENPTSSCIHECPSLKGCFAFVRPWIFTTYMGNFCGRSCKPLRLWSTLDQLAALEGPRPTFSDDALVRRDGNQFTGDKTLLAESEVYTPAFGRAVVQIFENVWNH